MRSTTVGWLTSMLSTLPVTDDQTWLNKLRPESRDSINHPRDPANTTPTINPATSANITEDREDVGGMPQDYHCEGRTLLSAGHCPGFPSIKVVILKARAFQRSEGSRAERFKLPGGPHSPASPTPPRASTPHGISTTRSLRIKSSRSQFRRRNLRRTRRILSSVGQHRREGSHALGRRLPRSRSQLLRHRRRVLSRRIGGNPRQSNRRAPQPGFNFHQSHVCYGRRTQRSRLLPLSRDPVLRGQPAPPQHRLYRRLPHARIRRADAS